MTATNLSLYRESLLKRYKPATVNRKLYTLKIFLRWADVGFAANSLPPLRNARLSPHKPSCPVWLEPPEQERLQAAVKWGGVARDMAILTLMLNTGLRISELIALHWRDVRLGENEANLIVREAKKGNVREVPLNQSAQDALLSLGYTKNSGSQRLPIFPDRDRLLTRRHIESLITRYCQLAGIEKGTPRIVRHTFCRNLVRDGVTPSALTKIAGFRNVETALRYYEASPDLNPTLLISRSERSFTSKARLRVKVIRRSKGKCERCGETREYSGFLQLHGPLKRSGSGDADAVNCFALCPNCHTDVHLAPSGDEIEAELVRAHEARQRLGSGV